MDKFSQHLQDICLGHAAIAKAGIEAGERFGKERIAILEATMRGVRGMAETEVANGSMAWAKAITLIDEALNGR